MRVIWDRQSHCWAPGLGRTWALALRGLSQHGTHTLKGPDCKSTLTWPNPGGCQNNLCRSWWNPALTLAWHCIRPVADPD